jgi:hypothetical protein
MANATEQNISNMMPPPIGKGTANVTEVDKLVTDGFEQQLYPQKDHTLNPPESLPTP